MSWSSAPGWSWAGTSEGLSLGLEGHEKGSEGGGVLVAERHLEVGSRADSRR